MPQPQALCQQGCSKALPLTERGLWDGVMVSSCIWHAMTEGKSLRLYSREPTSATRIQRFSKSWQNTCTANCSQTKGYISQKLFDTLFEDGIHLVTGLRVNMKNKLMPFYDKKMLRKRYIIETINDLLKNTAQIVHSRHRSVSNFIMNLISALGAYCFFENKPKALVGYDIEDTKN